MFTSQARSPVASLPRPIKIGASQKHYSSHVVAVLLKPTVPDHRRNIDDITPKILHGHDDNTYLTRANNNESNPSTVYNDKWFDKLAIQHISKSLQDATGMRNNKRGYDGLVQAAIDASRRFDTVQQRELVIQTLDAAFPKPILDLIKQMLPNSKFSREFFALFTTWFFSWLIGHCEVRVSELNGRREKKVVHIKKCRFMEQANCVGICTNMCKVPSQTFIKNSLGMPINMVPNFDDLSCEMVFGQDPPPETEDPAFNQPCLKLCKTNHQHRKKCF